ncbi:ABC transporter substrate-binding protein [Mesorhizobium australicum]|uniref:Peptide/nickel transport system substrate-binding protein n=1 Tax=Mesorhizobium australicum TaxID=536018 RepID=A0A1X7MQS0_9HYPH|nr:ABC transporter substrate-binding protein [Mesorhizobium australicum]SMH26691.1 peptide/nickel transport system substrate-binding protein [Mesorhizobium australicum]
MKFVKLIGFIFAAVATAFMLAGPTVAAPGGMITWGKPSEVLSTDAHLSADGTSWTMYYLIYDTLVTTTDDLKIAPGLAESWEQPTPTTYIFKLRKNAAFSSGRPLTSADVVGSLKRLADPKLGSYAGRQIGDVKQVVALDDHTVKLELKQPNTAVLSVLSVSMTAIYPIQELENGTFDPTKEMLGSGPFMVVEHRQDESWTLVRNPHYWRQGYPIVDKVLVRIIQDDAARLAGLRDGSVDIANFENPDAATLLKGILNVEPIIQKTTNYFRLDVSALQDDSPFKDIRVRHAMALALDRQRIVDAVFGGESAVDYVVPQAFGKPVCRDHPDYVTPREKRIVQARELLQEAGAENLKVGIVASSVLVTFPLIAQVMKANLADVGIDAEVQQIPVADWYQRVFSAKTDFDLALSWLAGYSNPTQILSNWNPEWVGWSAGFMTPSAEYNKAVNKVRQLPDGPERDRVIEQACQIIYDQANMLPLVSKPDYLGYRKDKIKARFSSIEGNFNTLKYITEFSRQD